MTVGGGACPISACGAALASGPLRAASARSNCAFAAATGSTSLRSKCATAEARAAARVDTTSQYSVQNLIETPPARHDIVGLILMMLPKKHWAELHNHRIVAHGFTTPAETCSPGSITEIRPPGSGWKPRRARCGVRFCNNGLSSGGFFCRTSVIAPLSQITRLWVPE